MQIIYAPDLPAVVLVRARGVFSVVIPDTLPSREVLELASLVLSPSEYEEVRRAVGAPEPDACPGIETAGHREKPYP
jgi:hypothetical protein